MKKLLATLLAGILAAGMLTGCNTGGSTSTASIAELAADGAPGGNTAMAEQASELSGTLTYWSYTDTAQNLVDAFEAMYPGVTINLELYSGDEYKTKLLTTIQSGRNIPDIFDLEEGYAYEFFESDALEDLSARGFDEYMAFSYDYIIAGSQATDGTLKGVTFQSSPVGFWYLRSEMEKWLGTSDEDELAAMMGSWDDILALAQQVQEDSNGSVYLWPNIVEMVKVVGFSYTPMVRDGVFTAGDEWYGLIDTMREFHESGAVADLGSWSEQWAAAWNNGDLLIRVMPSWDFFVDEANKGDVGIIRPFANSYEGATIVSMWSGSDNKELADEFLRFLCGEDWQRMNMEQYNQVPANYVVAREMADEGFSSADFGGQNLLQTYDEINSGVANITPDRYTRPVQNYFQRHANEGIRDGLSNEEIMDLLRDHIREDYPEITVN